MLELHSNVLWLQQDMERAQQALQRGAERLAELESQLSSEQAAQAGESHMI